MRLAVVAGDLAEVVLSDALEGLQRQGVEDNDSSAAHDTTDKLRPEALFA